MLNQSTRFHVNVFYVHSRGGREHVDKTVNIQADVKNAFSLSANMAKANGRNLLGTRLHAIYPIWVVRTVLFGPTEMSVPTSVHPNPAVHHRMLHVYHYSDSKCSL